MPNLLIVTTVAETLQAFLLPFASYFRTNGWRVDAMARGVSQCPRCTAVFDDTFDMNWSRNPLNPKGLLSATYRVRQVVLRGQYDIVHVHTPVASFITRLALRSLAGRKPKVVYTVHGFHFHPAGNPFANRIYAALETAAARWTDRIVVINETDARAAAALAISPRECLHYIPAFWIDRSRFNPLSVSAQRVEDMRRRLNLVPGAPLYLMVAELSKRKRPEDALRAFFALKEPKASLAFAGDGPLLQELQSMAEAFGIARQVLFLGHCEDIPTLMRCAVATILTSSQEGLPACVIESITLGVPVIGTDVRGTRDLLKGGAGILVPLGSVKALTSAMRRVIEHPEEVSLMSALARRAFADLDWLTTARAYEKIYHETLGFDGGSERFPVVDPRLLSEVPTGGRQC